jgi:hypothetical protein
MGASMAADVEAERAALQEEMASLQERMDEIREWVTEELLDTWPSPWKNDSMVKAKVTGRLGSNKEFQAMLAALREAEAKLNQLG